jgi:hypothetical protein
LNLPKVTAFFGCSSCVSPLQLQNNLPPPIYKIPASFSMKKPWSGTFGFITAISGRDDDCSAVPDPANLTESEESLHVNSTLFALRHKVFAKSYSVYEVSDLPKTCTSLSKRKSSRTYFHAQRAVMAYQIAPTEVCVHSEKE